MSTQRKVHLVETTLRDGGYEIDHQFTADDTAFLTGALDGAGFSYIELCHGNGVGTAEWAPQYRSKPQAAATDEQHLQAARSVAPRACYGVILVCGPEFTQLPTIDYLASRGVGFVRIAVVPEGFLDQKSWLGYIERIKAAGMIASLNLMQTAVLSVKQVAEGAVAAREHGADWFYVVDSFGGMTPSSVREYVRAIGESSGLATGLHAHNNGGLAVANCFAAIEAGATLVDSTLQGIGRATGNPATEVMLLALQRLGHERGIDVETTLALGDLARKLFAEKGNDPIHFVSGAAGIHSRAVPELRRRAAEQGRSPRSFLLRVGEAATRLQLPARDSFPSEFVASVLEATPAGNSRAPAPALVESVRKACVRDSGDDLAVHAENVRVGALRYRKTGVLHLVDASQFLFAAPLAWESRDLFGLSVPVSPSAALPQIERLPAVVVIDPAMSSWPGLPKGTAHTLSLSFAALVAEAAGALATALSPAGPIWIPDAMGLWAVVTALRLRGVEPATAEPSEPKRVVVTAGAAGVAERLRSGDRVITLLVGPARTAFVDRARAVGATVFSPPIGSQLAAYVFGQLEAARAATEVGAMTVGANRIVTPSIAPATGEIVVDTLEAPRRVVDGAAAGAPAPFEALAAIRVNALLTGKSSL